MHAAVLVEGYPLKVRAEGRGPLAVKLAGLAGGTGLFREEMTAAAGAGFRVAALDTTGDRADDPAASALDWEMLAADVVRGLDTLDARRAVLWGTSFGCLVCLATAARHPERVAGLLLCFPPAPRWRPPTYLRLYEWASRGGERRAAGLFRLGFVLLTLWEALSPATLVRLPGLARASLEAATPSSTIAGKLRLLWNEHPGLPPVEARIPASIIGGAWDTVALPSGARRLAAELGEAQLRMLPFAGHAGAYSRAGTYRRWAIEELCRLVGST